MDYALIRVPSKIYGRFVVIPSDDNSHCIMYLDDVIRFCLPFIFIGHGTCTFEAYSFKFTKDAEMEIDNNLNAGTLVREAAKLIKGGGGGAAHFATAGGKDTTGIDAAVDKVIELAGL